MHYKSNNFSQKTRLSPKCPYILVIEIVSAISLYASYIQRLECKKFKECLDISNLAYDEDIQLTYRFNHMKSIVY